MNTKTFTLPEYWASYLINGDHSGLDEKEKKESSDKKCLDLKNPQVDQDRNGYP